ncbi:ribosome-inactivating family protein [Spiroplasma endosymbiont of Tipula paludosa]|uniref:ribosome-inactivating family protein n=1 Tax=Spiroplasma endosymbiont of Tipula paludosa TaxID=3066295 RepID=UPI0035C880AE
MELIKWTINFLINRNIVVSTTSNSDGSSTRPYALNNHLDDNNIFIISISIQNNIINLVFRSRDLYLQGYGITFERDTTSYYLIHNHETINSYYHFDDSTTRSIGGYRSENLGFSSNYINLTPDNHSVSWSEMYESFINLISFQGNRNNINGNISIEGSLTNIIFYTSESLRFNSIRNLINQRFFSNRYRIEEGHRLSQNHSINWNDDNIHNIVNNWSRNSEQFYNRIKLLTNILTELPNQISILSRPGALAFFNFCIRDYNNRNYNKRIRRDLNNNELCSSANDLTPVYNYNDYFQVDYCFLCHDVIKINLARDTAIKIKEVFYLLNYTCKCKAELYL